MTRRGLTLIEAVAAVAILAIAVPPSVAMLGDAARTRAAAANAERAMWIGGAVLEMIAADVASGDSGLGFAALDDASDYLNHPSTGLLARVDDLDSFAQSVGVTFEVTIGPLVGPAGVATGDSDTDVFRAVSVQVEWAGARGDQSLTLSRQVTE